MGKGSHYWGSLKIPLKMYRIVSSSLNDDDDDIPFPGGNPALPKGPPRSTPSTHPGSPPVSPFFID